MPLVQSSAPWSSKQYFFVEGLPKHLEHLQGQKPHVIPHGHTESAQDGLWPHRHQSAQDGLWPHGHRLQPGFQLHNILKGLIERTYKIKQ